MPFQCSVKEAVDKWPDHIVEMGSRKFYCCKVENAHKGVDSSGTCTSIMQKACRQEIGEKIEGQSYLQTDVMI